MGDIKYFSIQDEIRNNFEVMRRIKQEGEELVRRRLRKRAEEKQREKEVVMARGNAKSVVVKSVERGDVVRTLPQ